MGPFALLSAASLINEDTGRRSTETSRLDATANARLNGLRNCRYSAGDAGEYMDQSYCSLEPGRDYRSIGPCDLHSIGGSDEWTIV